MRYNMNLVLEKSYFLSIAYMCQKKYLCIRKNYNFYSHYIILQQKNYED